MSKCIRDMSKCISDMPECIRDMSKCISDMPECIRDMPECIRDMPECINHYAKIDKMCKDSPLEHFFREFRIVRIDPSRHPIIDAANVIKPSFI